jgi:hypothetical protein
MFREPQFPGEEDAKYPKWKIPNSKNQNGVFVEDVTGSNVERFIQNSFSTIQFSCDEA